MPSASDQQVAGPPPAVGQRDPNLVGSLLDLAYRGVETNLDRAAQILVDRAGQVTSQQAEQSAVQRSHHPLIVKGRSRSPVPIDVVQLVHLVGDLPQAGQEAHGFCRLEAGTEEVDDVALLPQGIRPLDYIRFPPPADRASKPGPDHLSRPRKSVRASSATLFESPGKETA